MKVVMVKGPWVSFGVHIDFQKWYIDLHLLWWIVTLGNDYYDNAAAAGREVM